MRAKRVIESVNFQRGMDPKQALNIGRIQEIQRWIRFFDLDGRSDIVGLNVIVNGGITFSKFGPNPDVPDMPMTFPMDGLIIKGSFYMDRSAFTELPKSLTVQGPLDLTYYRGTELPENLIVTGNLVLVNPENPLVIPDNARIDGFIKLEKADLAMISVPDHLQDLLYFTDVTKFYESQNFERGQDPKSSMDIGMEPRTLHAGSIRYNRGSTTYLDKELAKRALRGEDTAYREYFLSIPGYDNTKGFYIGELLDPANPYSYIEYDGEIYPVIGKTNESVSFHRAKGVDDIKRTLRDPVPGELFVIGDSERPDYPDVFVYLGPAENPYNERPKGEFWKFGSFGRIMSSGKRIFMYMNYSEQLSHFREYYMDVVEPISDDDREKIASKKSGDGYAGALKRLRDYTENDIEPWL